MFYNNDKKQQYIKKYSYKETTLKRIISFFNKTSALEFLLDKDIAEFDIEEFETLFYSFKCKTRNSIKTTVSIARHYIQWRIINDGFPFNNILEIQRFKGHNLDLFVNMIGNELSYLKNRDELYKLVSMLVNSRDKAILCLLYEGVCGKGYFDLCHLRKQDCDFSSNTIKIMDRSRNNINRIVYCSSYTMNVVYDALHMQVYIKHNGKPILNHKSIDLLPSDYIIRTSKNNGIASGKIITHTFENLKKSDWNIDFCCKYLTPRTIVDSGMFNMVANLEDIEERILTDTEFKNILKYYGKNERLLPQYRYKYNIFKVWNE